MASGGDPQELEVLPASLRSQVWENVGFPATYSSTGERVVDKKRTVCRRCSAAVGYVSGNTSNMLTHINAITQMCQSMEHDKKKSVQLLLPTVLHQPLDTHTNRAKFICHLQCARIH